MASIGNHIKLDISRRLKDQVWTFYLGVLGCKSLPSPDPNLDRFEFDNGFVVGVFYRNDADVLPEQDQFKAAWLEIKVTAPEEVKQRLLDIGVKQVDYEDKAASTFKLQGATYFDWHQWMEDFEKHYHAGNDPVRR